jgi:Ran-binding protein 1
LFSRDVFDNRCCSRSKLMRFAPDIKEWKERGIGEAKLLKNRSTGKVRVLLRQEKTNKLVMNHNGI